jgi:endonuclease YncB( thermonuclease family)
MRFLLGVMLMLAGGLLQAEEFDASVIAVMDGDTVLVLHDNKKIKIRLANIDAPESAQPFGKESRQALLDQVAKKQIHVNSRAVDVYGRLIAELSLDGVSVNAEMVRSGMAWEYSHYHSNKHYLALQSEAQQLHLGLWSASDEPVKPETWRKLHPSLDHATHRNAGCGKKTRCAQMHSCEEANFYLKQCGATSLDANGDGIPCESLCLIVK